MSSHARRGDPYGNFAQSANIPALMLLLLIHDRLPGEMGAWRFCAANGGVSRQDKLRLCAARTAANTMHAALLAPNGTRRGEMTRRNFAQSAKIPRQRWCQARRALRGECYFYSSTTDFPERWELGDFAQQMAVINRQDKLQLCAARTAAHAPGSISPRRGDQKEKHPRLGVFFFLVTRTGIEPMPSP